MGGWPLLSQGAGELLESLLTSLRERFLPIENRLKPGDHICFFYESKQEQFQVVLPFLANGLAKGEKCLYAADENTVAEIKAGLLMHGVDVKRHLSSGQLVITAAWEFGPTPRKFDPETAISYGTSLVKQAVTEGYPGVRIAAEETWLLKNLDSLDAFLQYEAMVNTAVKDLPMKALCQYNSNRFFSSILTRVLKTHPRVLLGLDLYENPFYGALA